MFKPSNIIVGAMMSASVFVSNAFAADDISHGDAAHAQTGGLPQMDITTFSSQIFWLVITFGFLYIVLSKKVLPDISSVIDNRRNHIQSDLETAEKLTAEADQVQEDYNNNLAKAQEKATKAIAEVEDKVKAQSIQAMTDFRARSDSELKAAEDRINASKMAAMDDMNAIVSDTAHQAVEKIIGHSDEGRVRTIVENMNGKAKAA